MKDQFHFCSIHVNKTFSDYSRKGGLPSGFPSPRLAYIVNGECVCISDEGELKLKKGDVWSLPAHKGYVSVWTATPDFEFYYVQYEADFLSLSVKHFKKIENFDIKKEFITLYESENSFERLSAFYGIISKVSEFITEKENYDLDSILPALEYIRNNFEKKIKVKTLAELCYMSQSKFYTEFKKKIGCSPIDYKNTLKISRASTMIINDTSLEVICETLGYSSPSFLRRQMKKFFGKTPRELKRQKDVL